MHKSEEDEKVSKLSLAIQNAVECLKNDQCLFIYIGGLLLIRVVLFDSQN